MSSILLIVEGSDESKLFNRLKEVYNIDTKIFAVKSNIYQLYNKLKEYDFNGDIKTIFTIKFVNLIHHCIKNRTSFSKNIL